MPNPQPTSLAPVRVCAWGSTTDCQETPKKAVKMAAGLTGKWQPICDACSKFLRGNAAMKFRKFDKGDVNDHGAPVQARPDNPKPS